MSKTKPFEQKNFSELANTDKYNLLLKKRHRHENIFRKSGLFAIVISISFLALLIINIVIKSSGALTASYVKMPIFLDDTLITQTDKEYLENFRFRKILVNSISKHIIESTENRRNRLKILHLFSKRADNDIKKYVLKNPDKIGTTADIWIKTSSKIDQYLKKHTHNLSPIHLSVLDKYFIQSGKYKKKLNFTLFSNGDSTEPESAGIATAIIGSFFTMIIFLLASFPLAIFLSLYLEEFAKKNKLSDFIEINVNNLAAIPSIIYGLLGLSIFINFLHVPRSSSLVGGLTLSLMVLPTIVIATRNSIKAIPQNIKDAALAMGASPIQVALHHTLPLALPGIFTGTILAVSRALGETAPLIMIGMIAFIVDIPQSFSDPTTVLPVQIYLWSNNPEIGFVEKTSATILLLLIFLVAFNGIAILLRNKFSRRW